MQHEAGHFLVAYLVGILPRGYTLSSLEALQKEGSLNIQAGSAFVDFEFLEEVHNTHNLSLCFFSHSKTKVFVILISQPENAGQCWKSLSHGMFSFAFHSHKLF